MNTIDRALVEQALEALENTSPLGFNVESDKRFYAAIIALRAALAQQAEPEKECHKRRNDPCACSRKALLCDGFGPPQQAEFTEPVQEPDHTYKLIGCVQHDCEECQRRTQRKPLTEEEIDKIFKHLCNTVGASYKTMTRAVERAHGIKG